MNGDILFLMTCSVVFFSVKNRLEWEERGESIVEELVASYDEDK